MESRAKKIGWPAGLALAEDDPALGQIVGRELHADAVARDDADEVLAHPAGDVGHHDVPAFNLHAKSRIGESLRHHALNLQSFFFLFFHTLSIAWTNKGAARPNGRRHNAQLEARYELTIIAF